MKYYRLSAGKSARYKQMPTKFINGHLFQEDYQTRQ
jgi:hypothetical protein